MLEPTKLSVSEVLTSYYGIQPTQVTPIGYGLINWLARVDVGTTSYVLKRYNPDLFRPEWIELSVAAHHHGQVSGAPTPRLIPNESRSLLTMAPDATYVLFEQASGRHLERGSYSRVSAQSLGEAVAQVTLALGEPWRALREPWTLRRADEVVGRFEQLLAQADAGSTDLDRRTVLDVRLRLSFLYGHPGLYDQITAMPMQWVHNDFLETNVLFGGDDCLTAVLDFDNVTVLPRGFDFMRALAYCVTPRVPERDDYLRGYIETLQPSRDELATYVPLWSYVCICDIWPLEARYLDPGRFDPRWESASWGSFLPDDWEQEMTEVESWLLS